MASLANQRDSKPFILGRLTIKKIVASMIRYHFDGQLSRERRYLHEDKRTFH